MSQSRGRALISLLICLATACYGFGDDEYCEPDDDSARCNPPEPPLIDPRCKDKRSYCHGSVLVACSWVGEAYDWTDCADDATPRICVEGNIGLAFCAKTPVPDARCTDPFSAYCVGNQLTECREGFVTRTSDCAACIETNGFDGFCSPSAERTPRCTDPLPAKERSFCHDNWVVKCVDGYEALFLDCKDDVCGESYAHAQCW